MFERKWKTIAIDNLSLQEFKCSDKNITPHFYASRLVKHPLDNLFFFPAQKSKGYTIKIRCDNNDRDDEVLSGAMLCW